MESTQCSSSDDWRMCTKLAFRKKNEVPPYVKTQVKLEITVVTEIDQRQEEIKISLLKRGKELYKSTLSWSNSKNILKTLISLTQVSKEYPLPPYFLGSECQRLRLMCK